MGNHHQDNRTTIQLQKASHTNESPVFSSVREQFCPPPLPVAQSLNHKSPMAHSAHYVNVNPMTQTDPENRARSHVVERDLVLLTTMDRKRWVVRVQPGRILHTHRGKFSHDDLLGKAYGTTIKSQLGHSALIFEPALSDLMHHLKRGTQIIYPKDAAHLVYRLNLRAGCRVIEAGTGSGALTMALAWAVAPTGRIYTYEAREDKHQIAKNNLKRANLLGYVELFNHSIVDGFQQTEVDALMLDLRTPWSFLPQAHAALRPGGFFAALLPTTNQVSTLLSVLEGAPFVDASVEELLLRRYKTVPDRLRPEDEMIGHTGYMVFARSISQAVDPTEWLSRDRKRYRARQKALELEAKRAEENAQQPDAPKYPRLPLP